jgi:hypothetical protein
LTSAFFCEITDVPGSMNICFKIFMSSMARGSMDCCQIEDTIDKRSEKVFIYTLPYIAIYVFYALITGKSCSRMPAGFLISAMYIDSNLCSRLFTRWVPINPAPRRLPSIS